MKPSRSAILPFLLCVAAGASDDALRLEPEQAAAETASQIGFIAGQDEINQPQNFQ